MLFLYCVSVLVAVFKIQVAFSVLSFEASSNYVEKGSPFILTCHVTPLTGILQFIKNGSVVGSCSPPLVGLAPGTCSLAAIKQNISTENTTWNISSASFSTHNGTWKCVHLTETGETLVMITDLAKGITNNDASLPPNPDSNTEYKAFVECSYPKPIIKWTLRECRGTNNNIDVKDNPSVIEDPSTCTYPAQKYSSSIKVSSMASPGSVPKCYEPLATLYYSFASSAPLQIQSNVSFSLPAIDNKEDLLILLIWLIDLIEIIVFIFRLYNKIYKLDLVDVAKIAETPCQKWMISELRFECVVILVIKVIQAFIVVLTLTVKYKYQVGPVIGIAIALIVGCTAIYMVIFWTVIICLCCCRNAGYCKCMSNAIVCCTCMIQKIVCCTCMIKTILCCKHMFNKRESETTKESSRISKNGGDEGPRSPVPSQIPLTITEPDKSEKKEKKKKKKKKPKLAEEDFKNNISEIID